MTQSIIGTLTKDPDDVVIFGANWAPWAAVTEDTIVDCDIIADPGLTVEDCWFTITTTCARISGGTDDSEYDCTFRAYFASGEQYDRTVQIRCINR